MKILSLDLGSNMGYATGINERISTHANKDWTRKVDKDSEETAFSNESFAAFSRWLNPIVYKVGVVVCEKPNVYGTGKFSSYHAMRVLFGMYGIVQAACGEAGVSLIPVSATSVKKFWTGNGRAKKSDMIHASTGHGFKSILDHNECDAIAIYKYYWEELRGQSLADKEDNFIEVAQTNADECFWEDSLGI